MRHNKQHRIAHQIINNATLDYQVGNITGVKLDLISSRAASLNTLLNRLESTDEKINRLNAQIERLLDERSETAIRIAHREDQLADYL